ncbi:hypothetical protein ACHHYP_20026 [Achlya hypogyna]|uniref:Uncharacterized protein n=1 Tax=Achlya hypogyna TaxID=1202772 RepID=A0A1V9ZU96_ACHHY|nr:hypothetical protein ACHHYP_20026 [Achlya hypogyna]
MRERRDAKGGHAKGSLTRDLPADDGSYSLLHTAPMIKPAEANPLYSFAVLVVLILYLAACFVAYAYPPPVVPWEVEFALPYDPATMTSNCSVEITAPLHGTVTSSRVIEYALAAPDNASHSVHQVLQCTIYLDGSLVMTDLAILPRTGPIAFTTHELPGLAVGKHTVTIELLVPLRGGYEELIRASHDFYLVPPGHKVVKMALSRKSKRPALSLAELAAASRPRLLAPLNATEVPTTEDEPAFVRVRYIPAHESDSSLHLDGKPLEKGTLIGNAIVETTAHDLAIGDHIITLTAGDEVVDHVRFTVLTPQ